MADKTVDFVRTITNASGQIGNMHMHVEDGIITGIKLQMASVWLSQTDISLIQTTYQELRTFGTANGYTWQA